MPTVIVLGWTALNLAMMLSGHAPWDEPPFAWLETAVSLAALYVTVMILTTPRRDDELASHRDQLTLELAILNDQKSAKIIQLLEELRRDMPAIRDRTDHEATAMSSPADPQAVLDALKDSPCRDADVGVRSGNMTGTTSRHDRNRRARSRLLKFALRPYGNAR